MESSVGSVPEVGRASTMPPDALGERAVLGLGHDAKLEARRVAVLVLPTGREAERRIMARVFPMKDSMIGSAEGKALESGVGPHLGRELHIVGVGEVADLIMGSSGGGRDGKHRVPHAVELALPGAPHNLEAEFHKEMQERRKKRWGEGGRKEGRAQREKSG